MSKSAEAKARYDAANTKQYRLKLNLNTDNDIIELLDSSKNKQGYIKELIRQDMAITPFVRAITKKNAEGYMVAGYDQNSAALIMRNGSSEIAIKEDAKGRATIEEEGRITEAFSK